MIFVNWLQILYMPKGGPIVIIEDDMDDQETLREAIKDAGVFNQLIFFDNGPDAFQYLKTTSQQPFLILSDVNLPKQNGIEFKAQIDSDRELREKSIPFIFYTTYVSQYAVK